MAAKEKFEIGILENAMLATQCDLVKGQTIEMGRTEWGAFIEPFVNRKGWGQGLTNRLRRAAAGHPGIEVVQLKNKRVFVRITGL